MRSQLENLPQPDHHHVDQRESHDIVKILSIIFIVLLSHYFSCLDCSLAADLDARGDCGKSELCLS